MSISIDDRKNIYQMLYAMEMLSYRGISISETIELSLSYYMENYKSSKDIRYLELAVLQVKAGLEFGIMTEKNLLLYNQVCCLYGMSFDGILKKELYVSKKIKLSKPQVRKVFRKWMQSKTNGMTLSELVDDVICKVSNKIEGHYIYCYKKYDTTEKQESLKNDIYHLIVNDTECYLFDLKGFIVYTFEDECKKET